MLTDSEAQSLIDYLGLDATWLSQRRTNRIKALRSIFSANHWNPDQILDFFRTHRTELSYPTAIEAEFHIDLTEIIENIP